MTPLSAAAQALTTAHTRFGKAADTTIRASMGEPGARLEEGLVGMSEAKLQAGAARAVVRVADDMLGRLLDVVA